MKTFDFTNYEPVNTKQAEFHKSRSRHKLLMGGVGAGKTLPAIYEALHICYSNPGHRFAVFRNTWQSLEDNVEREFLEVSEICNCHHPDNWDKTNHNLILYNGCLVQFRPLGLKMAQIKGMNLCGFFIDDPDVDRYKKVIAFLYTRLRDTPKMKARVRETIICANWEGRNWLWQKYMRGRSMGGNEKFAWWLIKTNENPTLDADYIPDLKELHSDQWIRRYVECDTEQAYVGLVYPEYNPDIHNKDLSWCVKDKEKLIKINVTDIGASNAATVNLQMATDGKDIFIYKEFYRRDCRLPELGEHLQRIVREQNFRVNLIDTSSAQKEFRDGSSVKRDLRRDYGISTKGASKNIDYGIELFRTLLTVRNGKTHLYIDPMECPHTCRQLEIYKYKETNLSSDEEESNYTNKPVDIDNDCMDTSRYGVVELKKYLIDFNTKEDLLRERDQKYWEDRRNNLKMYKENPTMRTGESPTVKHLRFVHKNNMSKKITAEREKRKRELLTNDQN